MNKTGMQLRRPALIIIVLAGLVSLAGLTYAFFAETHPYRKEQATHALSGEGMGYLAARKLLVREGIPVVHCRDSTVRAPNRSVLAVSTPSWDSLEFRSPPLEEGAPSGFSSHTVLVLPKWGFYPDEFYPDIWPLEEDRLNVQVINAYEIAGRLMRSSRFDVDSLGDTQLPGIQGWQVHHATHVIRGRPLESYLSCSDGHLVATWESQDGETTVISDADLINNHGLHLGQNSANWVGVVRALMKRYDAEVVLWDDREYGLTRSPRPLQVLVKQPVLWISLGFALLLVATLWRGAVRFGPPKSARRFYERGSHALLQQVESHALMKAHTQGRDVLRYWDQVKARVASRFKDVPAQDFDRHLEAALDRRGHGESYRQVRDAVEDLKARLSALGFDKDAIEIAEKIHNWEGEVFSGNQ